MVVESTYVIKKNAFAITFRSFINDFRILAERNPKRLFANNI